MPKTAVETAVCDICGAVVRDGSLFCYNCGGSLSKTAASDAAPKGASTDAPVAEVSRPVVNGRPPSTEVSAKRRSERREQRPVRASNRQPTEIVWEPRQGMSWPFIIASVVFAVLALVMVIAAFYLR